MIKFLTIVSDMNGSANYYNPSELYARDKNEVYKLLLENVPSDNIVGIYTVDEYQKLISSPNFKNIQAANFDDSDLDGNQFFNKMISLASSVASQNTQSESIDNQPVVKNEPIIQPVKEEQPTQMPTKKDNVLQSLPPKFFMDNGIQFKLENNKLYKKIWQTVPITEYMNDAGEKCFPEFRIINKETEKIIKNEKYAIQQLVWSPIENQ
jgi:hypothetical protein